MANSVNIAMDWKAEIPFSIEASIHSSAVHLAFYPMSTEGYFSRLKRPGSEVNHSPPSSVEVKTGGSYTSTVPYIVMA
jgi:hypothetical protein